MQLKAWATANNLVIKHEFSNNLLLSVTGSALDVERALHTNLVFRAMRDGARQFVAVDREPSLDLTLPVLWITGLDEYHLPASADCHQLNPVDPTLYGDTTSSSTPEVFTAQDLRTAYLGTNSPCTTLDGTGQTVGVLSLEDYSTDDILQYIQAQDPNWPKPNGTNNIINDQLAVAGMDNDGEAQLDIEMILAMAPKARIINFIGTAGQQHSANPFDFDNADDLLALMATDTRITVASSSYTFGRSDNSRQSLAELAARGVSFFQAADDYGNVGDPSNNLDMPFQTLVGGTILHTGSAAAGTPATYCNGNTSDPLCYYASEETWNDGCPGQKDATGGGIMDGSSLTGCDCFPEPFCCAGVPIPLEYQHLDLFNPSSSGGNGGSTSYRNYPDVAMVADRIEDYAGGFGEQGGTSAAAPLWAGFAALANQYAAANGGGQMGFMNPVLYAIGETREGATDLYSSTFHDISDGTMNGWIGVPGFPTVVGFDLSTGWGSPTCNLLQQLGTSQPLSPQGFSRVLVHIANGQDGVDDDSSVVMDLLRTDGTILTSFTLKERGVTGWSDRGAEQDLAFTFSPEGSPPLANVTGFDVGGVAIHINGNDDDWDITGLQVFLGGLPAFRPVVGCLTDVSGRNGCDVEQPGCDTSAGQLSDGSFGVTRLGDAHPTATFNTLQYNDPLHRTFGGCAAWGGAAPVQAFDQLEFIFDTGDDDLNDDSIVAVSIKDTSGNEIESGFVHRPGIAWGDQTQWIALYATSTGRIPSASIGRIDLTLSHGTNHSSDSWHVNAVDVFGVDSSQPWEYVPLFHGVETAASGCGGVLQDFPCPEFELGTNGGTTTEPLETTSSIAW